MRWHFAQSDWKTYFILFCSAPAKEEAHQIQLQEVVAWHWCVLNDLTMYDISPPFFPCLFTA